MIQFVLVFASLTWVYCAETDKDNSSGQAQAGDDVSSFWGDFLNPPTAYRPWTGWWWPGDDVEDQELGREVRLFAEAGLGGAQIMPFTAGLDPAPGPEELARRMRFDTESFYGHMAAVMEAAREAKIGIDLHLGSGWPSGGAHVEAEQGLRTLLWNEQLVSGPTQMAGPLLGPAQPLWYVIKESFEQLLNIPLASWHGEEAELVAVLAARIEGGGRSPFPFVVTDTLDLDPDSVLDLTGQVDDQGVLSWQVPEGDWAVIEIYHAPDGEFPTLAAADPPGYVVDEFDRQAAQEDLEHLLGPRTGLPPYYGDPLRSFMDPSMEFKAERLFCRDFLDAFQSRRGYDLTPYLPMLLQESGDNLFLSAFLGAKPEYSFSQADHRIQFDYVLTRSELFLERWLNTLAEWADGHSVQSQAQVCGMDVDIMKASGLVHIPMTEQLYAGGTEMFLKLASSAGLLYDRPLVVSESFVWAEQDYMTTPLKIKAASDKLFTSGINSISYHGIPYRKEDPKYGETGWVPFSSPYFTFALHSDNFSEVNPYWKFMKDMTRYQARCQYLLRQGEPAYDLLVYYPWLGFPAVFGYEEGHEELLFSGKMDVPWPYSEAEGGQEDDERIAWLKGVWPLLQRLEDNGYSWAWTNDDSLQEASAEGGEIVIRGNAFHALVIPEAPQMQPHTATRLAELAEGGAAFLIAGDPPSQGPGFLDLGQGDQAVQEAMGAIANSDRTSLVSSEDQAVGALAAIGVSPEVAYLNAPQPIRHIRRHMADGQIIFFRNLTPTDVTGGVEIRSGCSDSWWIDPQAGRALPGVGAGDPGGTLGLSLAPYGSAFLVCGWQGMESLPEEMVSDAGCRDVDREVPLESWVLSVVLDDVQQGGCSGGLFEKELAELVDWQQIPELRFTSNPGMCRAQVDQVELDGIGRVELDLGWLHGAAEITVNQSRVGDLIFPPFRIDVTDQVVAGRNEIEVKVIPSLRNRLIGKAKTGDKAYAQFKNKEDTLQPAGLLGPTKLVFFRDICP